MRAAKWILPSGIAVPVVRAQVTLSRALQDPTSGQYRPHIVIGPQSQREAIRNGNVLTEEYLGVSFVDGPGSMKPGESAEVSLALIYSPHVDYSKVKRGATFTVREGAAIKGFGVILSDD